MTDYIVCSSRLKPSKIKGELPDVVYTYIANNSHIGFHHTTTKVRENAYVFDESELEQAKFISDVWRMKVRELF